jgi:hypothetical protein
LRARIANLERRLAAIGCTSTEQPHPIMSWRHRYPVSRWARRGAAAMTATALYAHPTAMGRGLTRGALPSPEPVAFHGRIFFLRMNID